MGMDIQYDLGAMRLALQQCDANIRVFEEAIAKERLTKVEYRRIIATLEEKKKPRPVHFEVVKESEDLNDEDF